VGIIEIAPLRIAANGLYPGKLTIASGGVDDLCGSDPAADLATNAETQLLRASASSNCSKVRVIFTLCEALYRIVAKKSSGITTLADLAGKRIMAPSGTSSAYFVSKMLGSVGLTTSQVTLVNGSPNGSTFNASNAVDAATIWEPGVEQASEALGADALEFRTDAGGTELYRELVNLHTTTDVLADATKRRGLVALVRSLVVASSQIRADPSRAIAVLTGPVGVSQAVLEKSLSYERFAGTLVPDLLDVMTQEEPWRASTDNRAARSQSELEQLIDPSVLSEALAGM
jgi:sulfonate transport system substrate-binding protein